MEEHHSDSYDTLLSLSTNGAAGDPVQLFHESDPNSYPVNFFGVQTQGVSSFNEVPRQRPKATFNNLAAASHSQRVSFPAHGVPGPSSSSSNLPIPIDDMRHFAAYPPYSIVYRELVKAQSMAQGLQAQLASTQTQNEFLMNMLSRQSQSPSVSPPSFLTQPLPDVPGTLPTPMGGPNKPSLAVSPEDAKRVKKPLEQSEYPLVRYWDKEDWDNHVEALGKKGKLVEHPHAYMETKEGVFIGDRGMKQLRAVAYSVWHYWKACGVLPSCWTEKQNDAVTYLLVALRGPCTFVFFCSFGWKLAKWATAIYPGFKRKHYNGNLSIVESPLPIAPADDESDSDGPPPPKRPRTSQHLSNPSSSSSKPAHKAASSSRPKDPSLSSRTSPAVPAKSVSSSSSRTPAMPSKDLSSTRAAAPPAEPSSSISASRGPAKAPSSIPQPRPTEKVSSSHSLAVNASQTPSGSPQDVPLQVPAGKMSSAPSSSSHLVAPSERPADPKGVSSKQLSDLPAPVNPPLSQASCVSTLSRPPKFPSLSPSPTLSSFGSFKRRDNERGTGRSLSPLDDLLLSPRATPNLSRSPAPHRSPIDGSPFRHSRSGSPIDLSATNFPQVAAKTPSITGVLVARNPLAGMQAQTGTRFVPPPIGSFKVQAPASEPPKGDTKMEVPNGKWTERNLFLLDCIAENKGQPVSKSNFKQRWSTVSPETKKEYEKLARQRKKANIMQGKLPPYSEPPN
ncbi:hypothetical protein NMY22_g16466 [Coprinellus aureogranulatus]|nr:hypothetical protein NMY22_g16466 [Coprinellus aureogranulatus]